MRALARSAMNRYCAGATELPHGCGTAIRLLKTSSAAVQAALRSAWSAARLELLGAPAPNLRKGSQG
jgi:urease accessory protein